MRQRPRSSLRRLLALLVYAAIGIGPSAVAQTPGTFARTNDMTAARSGHSATLLSNGHVLIAGGMAASDLATAEIYDPAARTFRGVGTMTTARRFHSATLLADEKVLIIGGFAGGVAGGALASAELFDPATRTFTPTGSLITARGGHSAILLPTGAVLVIGGYGWRSYPTLAPAELYDPASGEFRQAGAYIGRGGCDFCPPAVLLHDGTVFFAGQQPAQSYDPASDAFSPNGVMRFEPSAATVLTNGEVLFAGGEALGRLATAELYSPTTRTFSRTENMATRRVWHSLTALPDGTALAAGGETDNCGGNGCFFAGSAASAELYDPSVGGFRPTGSMALARGVHTATLLGDGRVLLAGGVSYGGIGIFHGSLASAELYTPEAIVPVPVLASLSRDGRGQGAIFHAGTTDPVTPDDPAAADDSVDIFCTGLPENSVLLPRVIIAGRFATVLSVNAADERGARVLRVRLPRGIAPGPAVSVRLIYMDRPSNVVTMAVR